MQYRVTDIEYDIAPEDVMDEFDEESFALRSDLIEACENRIDEILEDLPSEMVVDIDEDANSIDESEWDIIDDAITDAVSDKTGWLVRGLSWKPVGPNDFLNVKVGDIVICYDEYGHDYVEHTLKITSVEFDDEYKTDTNPDGKVCYGDELDKEAFGDDYLTVVTESNFTGIRGESE